MGKPLEPFPLQLEDEAQPGAVVPQIHTPMVRQQSHGMKTGLIITIVIAAILVIGGGAVAYWFFIRSKPSAKMPSQTTQNTAPTQPVATDNATSSAATQYVSNGSDLNLSFTYPSNWTASPASGGNSTDQPISVTSPLVSLSDANGQAITGKVVVNIRPVSAQLSELASDKAMVAQDSVQFAYTKPTSAQHQYPYLTYVHLAGGNNTNNVFEEVIITGVNKFTKGQALLPESLGGLDPIISAAFYQCATQACAGSSATPLSINDSTWQNTSVFVQTQALLASLQLH